MRKYLTGASALVLVAALSAPSLAADLVINNVGAIRDANAISLNVQGQDVDQSISSSSDDNSQIPGPIYNGDMNFKEHTFDNQYINSNNFNSGQNAAQQNGVAFSIDLEGSGYEVEVDGLSWSSGIGSESLTLDHGHIKPGTAAVSANALSQTTTQSIESDLNVATNGVYNGDMNFGWQTFNNQKMNANNFNSGMNAAQQGGVAVAVNLPKYPYPSR